MQWIVFSGAEPEPDQDLADAAHHVVVAIVTGMGRMCDKKLPKVFSA